MEICPASLVTEKVNSCIAPSLVAVSFNLRLFGSQKDVPMPGSKVQDRMK